MLLRIQLTMADYTQLPDQELLSLLQQGDHAAYTAIYHRYKKLLYTFAVKRLDNEQEVEDLLHELFLSLWVKRSELSANTKIVPYLYNAVRYQLINIFSKRKLSARYLDSFNQYLEEELDTDVTDHLIRHKELTALIETEIQALPKKMREVFLLSRETGCTRKEIAARLDLSEETVKSHMHHALKILKTKLGNLAILIFM